MTKIISKCGTVQCSLQNVTYKECWEKGSFNFFLKNKLLSSQTEKNIINVLS